MRSAGRQHGHVDFNTFVGDLHARRCLGRPTEKQLKADGVRTAQAASRSQRNGRARALGDTEGFVKSGDARTTDPRNARDRAIRLELISEGVVAMEFGGRREDWHGSATPTPSVGSDKEAALGSTPPSQPVSASDCACAERPSRVRSWRRADARRAGGSYHGVATPILPLADSLDCQPRRAPRLQSSPPVESFARHDSDTEKSFAARRPPGYLGAASAAAKLLWMASTRPWRSAASGGSIPRVNARRVHEELAR